MAEPRTNHRLAAIRASTRAFGARAWSVPGFAAMRTISVVAIGIVAASPVASASPLPMVNLVPNPSFEKTRGSDVTAADWVEGSSHLRSNEIACGGEWALKSVYTGSGTNTRVDAIPTTPNTTYELSVWIYKTSSTGAACIDMNDIPGEVQLCATQETAWQLLSGSWNIRR